MVLHGDLHIVPITEIKRRGCREVLQSTGARRHVVDGAGSVLVGTVGRAILVDLDLEPGVGGNPRRVVSDILLQRWIGVGGQVRPFRVRGMEPKENSRIVDWLAGASNRSGKAELQPEREVVEGFRRVIEDGMSSDRNSDSVDLAGLTWLRDQRPVDKGKASRSARSPALERPLGTI